jgi:hypothetical protein
LSDTVQLIVEHITQTLGEDERKNEVLKLWSLLRPADAACGIPNPIFE